MQQGAMSGGSNSFGQNAGGHTAGYNNMAGRSMGRGKTKGTQMPNFVSFYLILVPIQPKQVVKHQAMLLMEAKALMEA